MEMHLSTYDLLGLRIQSAEALVMSPETCICMASLAQGILHNIMLLCQESHHVMLD